MAGLGSINFRIGADLAEFRSAMQNVDRTLGGLSSKFNAVGGMIAGAFAVNGIQQFVSETSKLAGQADGVRVAFQRMAPAGLLEGLRKATRGTVSDLELMQNAVKAGNFGIPLKEMAGLLEFASRRAQETGESVDYLVQSIVTGIGRKSPMILDNLGISTSRLKAEFNGAAIEAQSIGQVTAAVAKIAKEEMSKAGTATITAADAAAQVTAQMTNLQVAIGDRLNQSMGPFLNSLGSAVGFFTDLVAIPLSDKYEDEAAAVAGLTVELTSADTAMERRRDILNYLNSKYPGYLENIDLEKTSMTDLAAATAKLNGELINRIVIQRQQEKIDKANEKVATKAESLAQSRIKLAAAVAKLEGDLNIEKTEGLTLEQRAQNAMAISIENAKKYRKATSGMFAQHNDVRAYYNSVVAGERNLKFEQDKVNNAIADRNAVMKELGITEEKANNLIKQGAAVTADQTESTNASTEAKRKDVDELGRSYDAMHDLKLAVDGLFDTIAKEGTVSEGMELKTLVGALKDGEKAAKSMNDEIVKAIGTYDLEPLTAEQAAFNEGLEDTVELLAGAINPMFNLFANNMETVNWAVGEFGNILTSSFEAALTSGEKFFPTLMTALGNMIKKLIAAAIAAAALAAAITIAFGGNFANIGKLFGGAKNFGQLFGGLFGGMSGIPGLAEGGIVTGPTLAMVGEGRGPEAVIPLDRLHEFTGGGGGVQVYGRIQGADILLSSERADRVRSRYRGF
jgi:hypothetical protein